MTELSFNEHNALEVFDCTPNVSDDTVTLDNFILKSEISGEPVYIRADDSPVGRFRDTIECIIEGHITDDPYTSTPPDTEGYTEMYELYTGSFSFEDEDGNSLNVTANGNELNEKIKKICREIMEDAYENQ